MRTLYGMRILFLLLALLMVSASCAQIEKTLGMEGGGGANADVPEQTTASYLEFEDVKIPYYLSVFRDDSFVYQSGGFKAGVLRLYGDVPATEVMSYFQQNMPRDGWTLLTSFKYQKNILVFTKAGRVCLVMSEPPRGWADLVVEVWMAPTESNYGSSSIPFIGGQSGDGSSQPHEETLSD